MGTDNETHTHRHTKKAKQENTISGQRANHGSPEYEENLRDKANSEIYFLRIKGSNGYTLISKRRANCFSTITRADQRFKKLR